MRYAALDDFAIYGVGETKEDALRWAKECGANPENLGVAPIEEGFANHINEFGFDPHSQSFDMVDGVIVWTQL